MDIKLDMKDINKILAKAYFKCKFKKNDSKKQHIFVETCVCEAVVSHALTSFSCSLKDKSSLSIFSKFGEP